MKSQPEPQARRETLQDCMGETQYAFLSMLTPPCMEERVARKSRNNMQAAATALQWRLYHGLCANLKRPVTLLNILPVGSYPQYYRQMFVRSGPFFVEGEPTVHQNIGFCNLKFVRNDCQTTKVRRALRRWCGRVGPDTPKVVFVYTMSRCFMRAVQRLKKSIPNLTICTIVADLPDMVSLSSHQSAIRRWMNRRLGADAYRCISAVDAFVLLTEPMAEYMHLSQPYCVVEGIATIPQGDDEDGEVREAVASQDSKRLKTVLYTGLLHERFGILTLLEAFALIEDPGYRLILCGVGDSEQAIRAAALSDARIDYRGQCARDEVLRLQREATVLVNPRPGDELFTKYSFPSKNLEYLSSGTPMVGYRLEGIPPEYDRYIAYVPESTSDDAPRMLAQTIRQVCEDADGAARRRAADAYRFVRTYKNEQVQTRKILDMLAGQGLI